MWTDPIYTSLILRQAGNSDVLGPRFLWILRGSVSFDDFTLPMLHTSVGILSVEPVSADVVGAPYNTSLLNAAYEMWKRYCEETLRHAPLAMPDAPQCVSSRVCCAFSSVCDRSTLSPSSYITRTDEEQGHTWRRNVAEQTSCRRALARSPPFVTTAMSPNRSRERRTWTLTPCSHSTPRGYSSNLCNNCVHQRSTIPPTRVHLFETHRPTSMINR